VIWSPCVGPTLGAAIALAAQGQQLGGVAVTIAAFGGGIAAALLAIALLGRRLFDRMRGGVASSAKKGKSALGVILLLVGLAILTGMDRLLEAAFLSQAPDWLIRLAAFL
jgi:cytochrome c-type biogenesis protein